jgi:hypothetical protein
MERKPVNTIHWKDFRSLELLKPLELFKCSNCSEIGFSATEAPMIDKAAESTLQQVTAHLIEKILAVHKCKQGELANRLGITETHLSHLKNGTKIIGFQTFNFLKTLALGRDAFEKASPTIPIKQMMVG